MNITFEPYNFYIKFSNKTIIHFNEPENITYKKGEYHYTSDDNSVDFYASNDGAEASIMLIGKDNGGCIAVKLDPKEAIKGFKYFYDRKDIIKQINDLVDENKDDKAMKLAIKNA